MDLIDKLIQDGWLKTPHVIEAFCKIKRKDFLPLDLVNLAEYNEALPIGYSQTISQPLVVAFMLEELEVKPGDKVLDIGSGSGWTSVLLAEIVGKKGKVIALEIIPDLFKLGLKNAYKYNFVEKGILVFICADGHLGYRKEAPFDKILCSAALDSNHEVSNHKNNPLFPVPMVWQAQVKIGGRIVVPVDHSIWVLERKSKKEFFKTEHQGFVFVPLMKQDF